MFLNRLKNSFRQIGVRLTLWFALIFGIGLLLVFIIGFFQLSHSLQNKDWEVIQSRWKDYGEAYAQHGIEGLKHRLDLDSDMPGGAQFVVGLRHGESLIYLHVPKPLKHSHGRVIEKALRDGTVGPDVRREIPGEGDGQLIEGMDAPWDHDLILFVGKDTGDRTDELIHYRRALLFSILPVLLLGLIAGFFFSRRVLEPIRGLSKTIRHIYEGNLSARVTVGRSGDELDDLGTLVNQMLGRIEMLMEAMKDTLDNVAHDLRTPIARFRGVAEMALTSQSSDAQAEALHECLEVSEDILKLLNTLMDLSNAGTGTLKLNLEKFDLADVVGDLLDLYRFLADEKKITIHFGAEDPGTVNADKVRITQALANLFDNAVKYTPEGGTITVSVCRKDERVEFVISDNGPGIPAQEVARIWERLYRGDKSRAQKGLGLGLSIVKANFLAHHGTVNVESAEGLGATFTAVLPAFRPV